MTLKILYLDFMWTIEKFFRITIIKKIKKEKIKSFIPSLLLKNNAKLI